MAGGQGSRLAGIGDSKALVPVDGKPLIEHVLTQLRDAGVEEILVEMRRDDRLLGSTLARYGSDHAGIKVVHADQSRGTGSSVRTMLAAAGDSDVLLSTVDTVAPRHTYRLLREFAESTKDTELVILATTVIDDDEPIFVHGRGDRGVVTDFGKRSGPSRRVFGNARWLSPRACEMYRRLPMATPDRDSELTRRLVKSLTPRVHQFTVDPVFDVDTPDDVYSAESWLRQSYGRAEE